MSIPDVNLPYLDSSTVVPSPVDQEDIFVQYLNRLYEQIAYNVNQRDFIFFPITITATATPIPNLANFGSFIVCVSGTQSGLPAYTWSLCKADEGVTGASGIAVLSHQIGTLLPWNGATLTITSSATNFLINHSVANTTGNFNIRIIGTQ